MEEDQVRKLLLIACLFGLAVAALSAGAASAGLSVCVKPNGAMRAVANVSACAANENPVELATATELAAQEVRIKALETLLSGASRVGNTLVLSGLNLQVVNGTGTTDSENSLGNVIIGYNSSAVRPPRSGSHNLVIGDEHSYTRHSGLVSGFGNTLSAEFAFVGGGSENTASGKQAFVGGGSGNFAVGEDAFVGGSRLSIATGERAFVGGGIGAFVGGANSFVGGGQANRIGGFGAGANSFIGGGRSNGIATDLGAVAADVFIGGGGSNQADGFRSFVGGGTDNIANGGATFIAGGERNTASGPGAFVGGGGGNSASGFHSFVGGGSNGTASTDWAFVGGGFANTADGLAAFVGGGAGDTAGPGTCAWLADINIVQC